MDSSPDLLRAAYQLLDFQSGALLEAASLPTDEARPETSVVSPQDWLDKGEWLALASQVGAERVLFVGNNPVVVFARQELDGDEAVRRLFNQVWCMARPRLLFLACAGDLAVYDLGKKPVAHGEDVREGRLLEVVHSLAEVSEKLARFAREQVESGLVFEDDELGRASNRADESLIRHLKVVRRRLVNGEEVPKLDLEHAHALIGRSIFIRYLEDRKILLREDFYELAQERPEWLALLDTPWQQPFVEPEMESRLYLKVLRDKEFTYRLFDYLDATFHGDIFPSPPNERESVQPEHLELLRRFLCGEESGQESLFFWAYDFRIIPIELISSIYEEFYHTETGVRDGLKANARRDAGSHYTPATLVEWVLSQTLTSEVLAKRPRVLDPAAGSGIFLVEAFRRIVRFYAAERGALLGRDELLDILQHQIAGIEINPHAAQIAVFSLYLAFLHSQQPPAIRRHPRLPHLLYNDQRPKGELDFDIVLAANAFDVEAATLDPEVRQKFLSSCADVVVGNPPWGDSGKGQKQVARVALAWCNARNLPVGDNEPSQQFIHRALDLLRDGGRCGLLVSTGVLLKQGDKSREFRQHWLSHVRLHQVTSFVHVRDLFFSGAIAPFASIVWTKAEGESLVEYWSAKKTAYIGKDRVVVLSRADLKTVPQSDLLADDRLWKVYWWGSHRDAALLSSLRLHPALQSYSFLRGESGEGFKVNDGRKQKKPDWLDRLKELATKGLKRYGRVAPETLTQPPPLMTLPRKASLFEGTRLLIKGAPTRDDRDFCQIIARLETEPYAVRHSIYSFPVCDDDASLEVAKIALGVLWSSLARYYFFLSDNKFGIWHEQIILNEFRQFPLALPRHDAKGRHLKARLIEVVDQLRAYGDEDWFMSVETKDLRQLEEQLDEAVFELYGLGSAERDLVRDLCEVGFDLFYNGVKSDALRPLSLPDAAPLVGFGDELAEDESRARLSFYLKAFTEFWHTQLGEDVELGWQIIPPKQSQAGLRPALLAVRFGTCYRAERETWRREPMAQWDEVLQRLDESFQMPFGSRQIYVEGMARIISGADIVIIKRNERRLWTPSAAREDAEAALVHVWNQQEMASQGSKN